MRAFARTLLLPLPLLACQDLSPLPAETEGADTEIAEPDTPPQATFVGRVDVIELCGVLGATVVSFRARLVGCERGPPAPCTLQTAPYKEWVGDAAICPGGQTDLDMRVVVPVSGRFEVEARAITDSGFVGLCYGLDRSVPTLVTAAQVEARAELRVQATSGPCKG